MAPPPPCNPNAPFGVPVEIASVNSISNEWSITLSHDGLWMAVGSDRITGENNLYEARRAATDAPFENVSVIASLDIAGAHESSPALSPDGLTLYFHSARSDAASGWDLYEATRPSLTASFGPPVPVPGINSDADDVNPFLSADGNRIYFSSSRSGSHQIWRATRSGGGQFAAPVVLADLDGQFSPVVSANELTIYFHRAGDIFVAHRTTTADGFGTPTLVSELSTSGSEYPATISADGCSLYFSSNGRAGVTGALDIFVATRGH